jgi:hypothetical protein
MHSFSLQCQKEAPRDFGQKTARRKEEHDSTLKREDLKTKMRVEE